MLSQPQESRHAHANHLDGWRRVLVPAQVRDRPGNVSQEGDGDPGASESQQGFHDPTLDHKVTQHWPVAGNVAQGPHSLKRIQTCFESKDN